MARNIARLALAVALAQAKDFVPGLSSALSKLGDTRVATVACCSAGSTPVLSASLGDGLVMASATALALVKEPGVADASLAVAASDVVLLELRQDDLIQDGPHGIGQLAPLLQRSLRLQHLKPNKKLLLVVVVDADEEEATSAQLAQLARGAAGRVWDGLLKPADCAVTSLDEMFELELCTLPPAAYEADEHRSALEALKARFTSADADTYFFAEGRYSSSSSSAALTLSSLADQPPPLGAQEAPTPSEARAAYSCAAIAEAATKQFSRGLSALKKESESAYLADFGEKAGALLDECFARYDEGCGALNGAAAVASTRMALRLQLIRALHAPFRKQLMQLQKQAMEKFSQKIAALKPSAEVEAELKQMTKVASDAFVKQAEQLLPSGVEWSYSYEKSTLGAILDEQATNHVETLRVQGLYLPKTGQKIPVDFSAHYLMLSPFGQDSRYDGISSRDKPKFRPQASPMQLRATNGYKAKLKGPEEMVFKEKLGS